MSYRSIVCRAALRSPEGKEKPTTTSKVEVSSWLVDESIFDYLRRTVFLRKEAKFSSECSKDTCLFESRCYLPMPRFRRQSDRLHQSEHLLVFQQNSWPFLRVLSRRACHLYSCQPARASAESASRVHRPSGFHRRSHRRA